MPNMIGTSNKKESTKEIETVKTNSAVPNMDCKDKEVSDDKEPVPTPSPNIPVILRAPFNFYNDFM